MHWFLRIAACFLLTLVLGTCQSTSVSTQPDSRRHEPHTPHGWNYDPHELRPDIDLKR